MKRVGFEHKLLAKLRKLDHEQVQNYLSGLLNQRQFLQTILDHLDEGLIVTSGQLSLLFANRRARTMLGWPRGKAYLGDNLTDRIGKDHPLGDIIRSLGGHFRAIDNYECAYGSKQDRILSLTTVPMRGKEEEDEESTWLLILLRDVTERYRRQNEQARARRLASLATLTAGIAHEIKNPLNSLNIHAQLLQAEVNRARSQGYAPDGEKTGRACQVILEESARLTRIVEDFIQAARPRTPELQSRPIGKVMEQVRQLFSAECEEKGIRLTLNVEPDLPLLLIDEHLLLQALRNLIRNSLEALPERIDQAAAAGHDYLPAITLRVELQGDYVNVSISDNGPGIAEGALEQIFEPYYTTKFGGSGLGLMVVYRIVTEHRGLLHVDTKPGDGTKFIISLPLDQRPVRLLDHKEADLPVKVEDLPAEIEKTMEQLNG